MPFSGADGAKENEECPSATSQKGLKRDGFSTTPSTCGPPGLFSLCEYVVIGFAAGIIVVLAVGGLIICCIRVRQKQLSAPRATRMRTRKGRSRVPYNFQDDFQDFSGIEEYSSGTHETVYDSETESAVRTTRCQKCGTIVSTSTLDKTPEKQVTYKVNETKPANYTVSKSAEKKPADYTWRGVIDGNEEVINTQLRVPPRTSSEEQETLISDLFEHALDKQPGGDDIICSSPVQQVFKVYTTAEIERNTEPLVTL